MSNKLFNFINLHNGEEEQIKVLEQIKSNISFRGSNLWILACAIVIASIGLNVNSTAVIIGAMLISPLMSPIVGAGFALAINDFELLKKSGKNLFIATIVSLMVAATYFFLSPFKEAQTELLARTTPNIYDVLIAFFGGLVGVIALTRVEKGNPIPGVAIATALMPPLCTAGYGLATGNFSFFFGAFYLYAINCFFICVATFLIIKFLKYEPVTNLNLKFEKRIKFIIVTLILVMIVPSIYFANNHLNEKRYSQKVEKFIADEFVNRGYAMFYKKVKFNSNPKKIELAFLTKKFTLEEISKLKQKLLIYNITDTELEIKQNIRDLKSEILSEIQDQNNHLSEKDILIDNLQKELIETNFDSAEIEQELNILFPELKNFSIGKHHIYQNSDSVKIVTVILYQLSSDNINVDTAKVRKWLSQKLKTTNVQLIKKD